MTIYTLKEFLVAVIIHSVLAGCTYKLRDGGEKNTVLTVCKNSPVEGNMRLQQSDLVKSGGYLPILQPFKYKIPLLCFFGQCFFAEQCIDSNAKREFCT